MKVKILIVINILIILITIFSCFNFTSALNEFDTYYAVYYNGELLGVIESEQKLNELINYNNEMLMKKYDTDRVYNPEGIKISEYYARNIDIISEDKMYDIMTEKSAFTILGYKLLVKSDEKEFIIYTNKKEYLLEGIENTVLTYISEEHLNKFRNDLEVPIENGKIELIGIEEDIYIYEELISTDKTIYTDVSNISKLMLYQTLEEQEKYIIENGDNIEIAAEKNRMNSKEFLIANPKYTSKDNLLTIGEVVNVGLTNPIFTSYLEQYLETEQVENYQTEIIEDPTQLKTYSKVVTEGIDGLNLIKEQRRYENGQLVASTILNVDQLIPPVNKVVIKGTKKASTGGGGVGYNPGGYEHIVGDSDNYAWPTNGGYKITTWYEWRWGSFHPALDIAIGTGSPIYAVAAGTVERAEGGCSVGYSSCNGGYGNNIYINHNNGLITHYSHLQNINVLIGQGVQRGQQIGTMGNTGFSTGPHLDFETIIDGKKVNPCNVIRC